MILEHDYQKIWEEKFSKSDWGRYPPEDLVRFIGRNYRQKDRKTTRILEVGCGPGANIWFLHREGFDVSGIDGAPIAIEQAENRITRENHNDLSSLDLRVGNFAQLPWSDESFDVVIDVFAIYANPTSVIAQVVEEVYRVLKPGGKLFCKLWGTETTGFGQGDKIEDHTFTNIPVGPCAGFGVSHFFDRNEIKAIFHRFNVISIDRVFRSDIYNDCDIEEFVCIFIK